VPFIPIFGLSPHRSEATTSRTVKLTPTQNTQKSAACSRVSSVCLKSSLGQVYVLGFIAQRLDAGVGSKSRIQLLSTKGRNQMSIAMIVIVTIAIILAITGSLVQSLNFLIWVGLVLLALAVISLLLRAISGRK
jgi:hypothetical protein